MAAYLLVFVPCLFAVVCGIAPPVAPLPARPIGLPHIGMSARTPAFQAGVAEAPATSAGYPAHSISHFRGQLPRPATQSAREAAEEQLVEILGSTSWLEAGMHFESELLQVPRAASGGPSVAGLLDVLETFKPPQSFEKHVLIGEWYLEYIHARACLGGGCALPAAVREFVEKDPVIDLSAVLSISDAGTVDTFFTMLPFGGSKKLVTLPGIMTQYQRSPFFTIKAPTGDSTSVEVTYVSDNILVMRRNRGESGAPPETSPGTATEVWRKMKHQDDATASFAGPASLWRFGVPYDSSRKRQIESIVSKLPRADGTRIWTCTVLLAAFVAVASSFGLRRRWDAKDAADTKMRGVTEQQPRVAVAAFTGESFPKDMRHSEDTPPSSTDIAAAALLLSAATSPRKRAPSRQQRKAINSPRTARAAQTSREAINSPRTARAAQTSKIDWTGAATGWEKLEQRSLTDVDWLNEHGALTVCSVLLFLYQCIRIASHQAPSQPEVLATVAVYLPWIFLCFRDTSKLEGHYQVTFYASCGWGFMSLASLVSVFYQDRFPDFSLGVLTVGNIVFAVSSLYFYFYHWTRMWRHFTQNRFRPFWIPGLFGLMCLHGLTIADFYKRLDDPGWWKTVCQIYSDEWWWVADVRIIELFVTAAALWLIILHIQGVFTGMKNAAVVVVGTIFMPLALMIVESSWLRASAWQHYLMVGPKYW